MVAGLATLVVDIVKLIAGDASTRQKYGALVEALFTDPLGTVSAVLWSIVEPIVTDWQAGRYGEAIGRTVFELLPAILAIFTGGTTAAGYVSKVGTSGRAVDALGDAGRVMSHLDDAARIANRIDDAGRVASRIDDAGRIANRIDDAGRVANRIDDAHGVSGRPLRPGDVGSYYELSKRWRHFGSDGELEIHHMPQTASGHVSHGRSAAIALTKQEHAMTRNWRRRGFAAKIEDAGLSFRQVLAKDIRDIRRINRAVGSNYRSGLLRILQYYRQHFPHLIKK